MFNSKPDHNYCKDDQDEPNPQHDHSLDAGEEQNIFVTSLLQAIRECEVTKTPIEYQPPYTRIPVCNNETLVEYARSLVAEKDRERSSFASRQRAMLSDRGSQNDPIVIPSPPSIEPSSASENHQEARTLSSTGQSQLSNDTVEDSPIYFDSASDPEYGYLAPEYRVTFVDLSLSNAYFTSFNDLYYYRMAKFFGDDKLAEALRNKEHIDLSPPYERLVAGFDRSRWQKCKHPIIEEIVHSKFWRCSPPRTPEENILQKLLNTGDENLFYNVPDDCMLGIWASASIPPEDLQNANALGRALMTVRTKAKKWLGNPTFFDVPSANLSDPREEALLSSLRRGYLTWSPVSMMLIAVPTEAVPHVQGMTSKFDCRTRRIEQAKSANEALRYHPHMGLGPIVCRLRDFYIAWQEKNMKSEARSREVESTRQEKTGEDVIEQIDC